MSWQDAFDVIKRGHEHRDVPFKLASGQTSQHYIDGKHAVDTGARLAVVCRAVVDLAAERQIEFDAVGGLTMGADALAHGVAMVTGKAWFSVRKEPKSRGLEQFIDSSSTLPPRHSPQHERQGDGVTHAKIGTQRRLGVLPEEPHQLVTEPRPGAR